MNEAIKKKNKVTLVLLGVLFASPLILSWFVFNYIDFLALRGTSNHGQLIEPPRQLGDLALIDPLDEQRADSLFNKWSLLYFGSTCDQPCMQSVYLMRQIHSAMDKHSLRVQRVLLLVEEHPQQLRNKLVDYAGQQLIDNEAIEKSILDKFKLGDNDKPLIANRIYIVDPRGNLILSYEAGTKPKKIYSDLKKLLRASRIG